MLRFSKKIICYDENLNLFPKKFANKIFTISPILKKQIYNIAKNEKKKLLNKKKILIIGGSQGAKFFDQNIFLLISKISKMMNIEVYQQFFEIAQKEKIKLHYKKLGISFKLFKFDPVLYNYYHEFDLAITRSGASAISELCFFKVPFLAIPFPYSKDNHQYFNAMKYKEKNSCWILEQKDYKLEETSNFIIKLLNNNSDYFEKKNNLSKISNQNTWNNINKKLLSLINEN